MLVFWLKHGMYKNRVENDRNFFETPAVLSCEQGNSAENETRYLPYCYTYPAGRSILYSVK